MFREICLISTVVVIVSKNVSGYSPYLKSLEEDSLDTNAENYIFDDSKKETPTLLSSADESYFYSYETRPHLHYFYHQKLNKGQDHYVSTQRFKPSEQEDLPQTFSDYDTVKDAKEKEVANHYYDLGEQDEEEEIIRNYKDLFNNQIETQTVKTYEVVENSNEEINASNQTAIKIPLIVTNVSSTNNSANNTKTEKVKPVKLEKTV